jgi:hypothetical protein
VARLIYPAYIPRGALTDLRDAKRKPGHYRWSLPWCGAILHWPVPVARKRPNFVGSRPELEPTLKLLEHSYVDSPDQSFLNGILEFCNTKVRGWRLTALWKGRITALLENQAVLSEKSFSGDDCDDFKASFSALSMTSGCVIARLAIPRALTAFSQRIMASVSSFIMLGFTMIGIFAKDRR